jgi:alkylation response protein AidB-like acyl-CoA dehydrogenase
MDIVFNNVVVPKEHLILGEGRGFEMAQGRLGPGRIHHCMRVLGTAERSLENLLFRTTQRKVFGKYLMNNEYTLKIIAKCRTKIDQAKLLVLFSADKMDEGGSKFAKDEIAMIKIVAPNIALDVIDEAIQIHGGEGVSQDTFLAYAWVHARTLKLADGPDEVHLNTLGKSQLSRVTPKF